VNPYSPLGKEGRRLLREYRELQRKVSLTDPRWQAVQRGLTGLLMRHTLWNHYYGKRGSYLETLQSVRLCRVFGVSAKELAESWGLDSTATCTVGAQTPPDSASFLFYLFMPYVKADAIVGDLEEGHSKLSKKFGRRRANFWYYFQTFISLRPIVLQALKKSLMKPVIAAITWAVGSGLIKHDGWLAAVVEFFKKVVGA
jgi:hypothetical protein